MAPLVITLHFDALSQAYFEEKRRRYFPPQRNRIPAHLTLFHQLPDVEWVHSAIADMAERRFGFSVAVTGLRSLGHGVAFALGSHPLLELHAEMSKHFESCLIAQDRQPFRPHVVIQNKASAETARDTLSELEKTFEPFSVEALGVDIWIYREGWWDFQKTVAFAPLADRTAR